MVAIIDYGMGNVASVQKAIRFLKIDCCITSDFSIIEDSTHIILPGVGAFYQGMKNLKERGLIELLSNEVLLKKKKFMGICLGMQLLAEKGFESCESDGLGWVKGEVVRLDPKSKIIPHMGWNNIEVRNNTFFKGIQNNDFYFIHSYHFVPESTDIIAATVNYELEYVASIQQDNIFATQFHPEKSQNSGLTVLKSFLTHA